MTISKPDMVCLVDRITYLSGRWSEELKDQIERDQKLLARVKKFDEYLRLYIKEVKEERKSPWHGSIEVLAAFLGESCGSWERTKVSLVTAFFSTLKEDANLESWC